MRILDFNYLLDTKTLHIRCKVEKGKRRDKKLFRTQ